jgi:hypothetical protein
LKELLIMRLPPLEWATLIIKTDLVARKWVIAIGWINVMGNIMGRARVRSREMEEFKDMWHCMIV